MEKPLFLIERGLLSEPDDLPSNEAIADFLSHRLTKDERAVFLSLKQPFKDLKPLQGRVKSIASTLRIEETGGSSASEAIPMFPTICKINHSCIPNAYFWWNKTTACGVIHAIQEIQPGEEITVAYSSVAEMEYFRRLHRLKDYWNITCSCTRCLKSIDQRQIDDIMIATFNRQVSLFRDERLRLLILEIYSWKTFATRTTSTTSLMKDRLTV